MAYTTTVKVRKNIPLKFVVALIICFLAMFTAILMYFVPSVQEASLTFFFARIVDIQTFLGWMLIPQVLIAGGAILVIMVLVTQRKYIFKKKVTILQPSTALQTGLAQPALQPAPTVITEQEVEKQT